MEYISIGKIVNTFGIKGELKVVSSSEFIEERFMVGRTIYLGKDKNSVEITSLRLHKGNILITVNKLYDINQVLNYVNQEVFADIDDIEPLDDGYYLFELKDLDVYLDDKIIGKVIEAEKHIQTLLKVQLEDKIVLIPFVDAFIKDVDLENNRIDIEVIEGLI